MGVPVSKVYLMTLWASEAGLTIHVLSNLEQTILDFCWPFWWVFPYHIQDCFESVTPSSDETVKTFLEKACKALIAAKVEFLGRTCGGASTDATLKQSHAGNAPWKIKIWTQSHGGLEDYFPFQLGDF